MNRLTFLALVGPVFLPAALFARGLSLTMDGIDISFFGRKPDTFAGDRLEVAAGVEPGVRVLFDASTPEQLVLRPARDEEHSNDASAVYRFAWQAEKSARFYELANPAELKRLSEQNAKDTASTEGRAYELKVVDAFVAEGKVLQTCVPPTSPFQGSITAYVVVAESGQQERIVVLPEGSVAECIAGATSGRRYPVPARRFTAQVGIDVTE